RDLTSPEPLPLPEVEDGPALLAWWRDARQATLAAFAVRDDSDRVPWGARRPRRLSEWSAAGGGGGGGGGAGGRGRPPASWRHGPTGSTAWPPSTAARSTPTGCATSPGWGGAPFPTLSMSPPCP